MLALGISVIERHLRQGNGMREGQRVLLVRVVRIMRRRPCMRNGLGCYIKVIGGRRKRNWLSLNFLVLDKRAQRSDWCRALNFLILSTILFKIMHDLQLLKFNLIFALINMSFVSIDLLHYLLKSLVKFRYLTILGLSWFLKISVSHLKLIEDAWLLLYG